MSESVLLWSGQILHARCGLDFAAAEYKAEHMGTAGVFARLVHNFTPTVYVNVTKALVRSWR